MPKSRNSRSASPHKSVSAGNIAEFERKTALQNVHDIFREAVDIDVIQIVLQECNWKEEDAVDKLLVIAESHEEQRRYKSKLHRIAEGVFGSLRSEDYGGSSVGAAASRLSPSEKVIRRPAKAAAASNSVTDTARVKNVGSSELLSKGLPPKFYLSGAQGNGNSTVDEIEMDLHFPQLPKKSSETNLSSASSSVSSHKSFSDLAKTHASSKTALLSQAQSAFNQQFDDAEGTQRWEQYKQKLSEHYLINLTKDNVGAPGKPLNTAVSLKQSASVPDDPAILKAELESPRSDHVIQKERSESARNFPVRLLSRSPDTVDENTKSSGFKQNANLDSADLDETVLKCIYEVQGDLLDDKELERSCLSQNPEQKSLGTPTSQGQSVGTSVNRPVAQQSNEAMTLPTIGLSVDAEEFVPRAKPAASPVTVTKELIDSTSQPSSKESVSVTKEFINSTPQPASKGSKSSSIEIKSGVINAQINTSCPVRSPLTISPSLSPGISPPTTLKSSPVANLTGSPMFITPKWPPVLHSINHPPPMAPTVLASTSSRFVGPTPAHNLPPQGYRFAPAVPLPYSSRMVYTVAPPPPMFRMAGMPQYVQQPNVQIGDHLEDRAAIATGQPIMATSESSRLISLSTGQTSVKLSNQTYIEQKVERIHSLQKLGLKVLVIVRGLPGSGKSTLARALQLNGIVLSTDDYFMKGNIYEYNPEKLTEAHQWNRERTKEAMKHGKSPVIIDNTNTQIWEFKPYASLALAYNYHIELMEPSTPWKYKASELARRTLHGVPKDQIERMSNRYEHNVSVDMLVRKRKADTKSGENHGTEEGNGFLLVKPFESTASQGEASTHDNHINENRNSKDLRLQTFYKIDDFRKQKSVESDSDSISSYNSGSLSNQSSRNASPKPLRPSLKTPGALQKMEKLKPPSAIKPKQIKPAIKVVKKKDIKTIELKLSSQTVEVVNDIVNEHIGNRVLLEDGVHQLENELKALLIIYGIDESEIPAAEELIGFKLHGLINEGDEILEDEGNVEGDTRNTRSLKNSFSDSVLLEMTSSDTHEIRPSSDECSEKQKDVSLRNEYTESKRQFNEISDDLKDEVHKDHSLNKVIHKECKTEEDVSEREYAKRKLPSWTSIAASKQSNEIDTDGSKKIVSDTDFCACKDSNGLEAFDSNGITSSHFEYQYWGKGENPTEISSGMPWNDTALSDWMSSAPDSNQVEQGNIDNHEEGAKPQRNKRNRSNGVLQDLNDKKEEIAIVQEHNEKAQDAVLHTDSSNKTNNTDKNIRESQANDSALNGKEVCLVEDEKSVNVCQVESCHDSLGSKDTEVVRDIEVTDVNVQCNDVKTPCSSIDIHDSQSQDNVNETSSQNSSLLMLKESYTVVESTLLTNTNTADTNLSNSAKFGICDTNICNDQVSDGTVVIRNDFEEIFEEKLTESLNLTHEKNTTKLGIKNSESFELSLADSENEKPGQSTEDLTSSQDSEMDNVTPQTSPQKMSASLSTNENKKPSKRKMAANLKGPFLKHEDREKFKTTAWNSFPLPTVEKQTLSPFRTRITEAKDVANAATMTNVEYFNLTEQLNQGEFIDSSITYLIGNPKKLVNGQANSVELNDSCGSDSKNEVHMLEKSTSTQDLIPLTDTESVEFLQTCFPTVPIGELVCVLENCDSNTEWAINLLLDWKYNLKLSDDEKKKFQQELADLKRASPTVFESHSKQKNSRPNSLLDICFSIVEKEHIASREEIEKQLIQTGKERLDRIEDDKITKIRLYRSSSLNETSSDTERVSPDINELLSIVVNSQAEIDDSVTDFKMSDHVRLSLTQDKGMNGRSKEIDYKSELVKDADIFSDLELRTDSEREKSGNASEVVNTGEVTKQAEMEIEDIDLKPVLSMNVDTKVIRKLEDLFGSLGNKSDIQECLSVQLDRKTAWLIYQSVKTSIILERSRLQQEQQQLEKDEELARQLQEEENYYIKLGTRNRKYQGKDSYTRTRRATPLVGLSIQGTITQQQEPAAWNKGNQSLAEIIEEEQRIQASQEKFKRMLEKEGGHTSVATCLKRQKLYGRFPDLDRKILDEILAANCFNITETIAAISTSLEESNTRETSVYNRQEDLQSDEKLLEASKQQSVQEMLDSYIYHSFVSKDYQDGVEPEYEDYRGEANLHFRLRQECFQKAREAYRRGLKQVASFYSQQNSVNRSTKIGLHCRKIFQGHQHTQKIKEANMRASEQILAERNIDLEKNMTLDLHGLHVDEAIAALNRVIPQKEKERCKKLTIITGRGSHSRGGVARLRPSVIVYLKSNKYNYTEVQLGVFSVPLKYRSPDR